MRVRRAAFWAAVTAAVCAAVTAAGGASTTYTHGFDVSWPQCSDHGDGTTARYMPGHGARFLILGLTHGEGETQNPCLPAQLRWARDHGVPVGAYLVPSFPTPRQLDDAATGPYGVCGSDTSCRLANAGAREAADAIETMHGDGVPAPMVWVDVEFRHVHPWSRSRADNRRVLQGVFTGLREAHLPFGVYTTSYMWSHITGGARVDVPNWLPAGSGNRSDAARMCRTTATGGTTWIAQYTRSYDENVTCPAMDATPGHHGPLYRYRDTVLATGDSGSAVTALQRALGEPAATTGSFDDRTLAAVVAFQVAHLLPTDGRVDNDDWRALGAYELVDRHGFLLPQVVAPVG